MSSSDYVPLLPGPGDQHIFAPGPNRDLLEKEILPGYIGRCRWFGGKARHPRKFRLEDLVAAGSAEARLAFVEIDYEEGPQETYLLPLQICTGEMADTLQRTEPKAVIGRFQDGAILSDALHHGSFRNALFELMAWGGNWTGEYGRISGSPGAILVQHLSPPPSRALSVEQSNSSIIYGEQIFLKLYRRLEEGVNPDAEILRFLGEQNFPHVPPFGGAIEYEGTKGGRRVLALALGLVPNDGDAWSYTLQHLAAYYGQLRAGEATGAADLRAEFLEAVAQLGTRTGELHRALAGHDGAAEFAPETLTQQDTAATAEALRIAVQQIDRLLLERFEVLEVGTRRLAQEFRAAAPRFQKSADQLARLTTSAAKTRTHGDYHLGQVLHGPGGFVIIDFEGEPLRTLLERRRKMSPFRDVAGMLRSFHYAAHAALEPLEHDRAALGEAAEAWAHRAQETFLEAWRAATDGAVFRDPDPAAERALLNAFLLEKALYEVRYEVNNRPTWLGIPLRGVLALQ